MKQLILVINSIINVELIEAQDEITLMELFGDVNTDSTAYKCKALVNYESLLFVFSHAIYEWNIPAVSSTLDVWK